MFTNAPTLRCITYMHYHVDVVSLGVNFFFQRNILIGSFLFFFFTKIFISDIFFPKLHFVFLLALHFQSSSNLSSLYTFFYIYIKGTIVEKLDLNFFKELFWSLGVFQPNLRNPTWIHREKSSPLQTCKCVFFFFKEEKDLLFRTRVGFHHLQRQI